MTFLVVKKNDLWINYFSLEKKHHNLKCKPSSWLHSKVFFFIPWNSFQQHSDPRMFSNIHQLFKSLTNKYNYYWTTDFIRANKAEQINTPVTDGVFIG